MKKAIFLVILLTLLIPTFGTGRVALAGVQAPQFQATFQPPLNPVNKVDPRVRSAQASIQPQEMQTVIVTLADQSDLSGTGSLDKAARLRGVIQSLQSKANTSQRSIKAFLATRRAQGRVAQVTPFWVFNGLSITATPDVIDELAARPDVLAITPDDIQIVPTAPLAYSQPEANLSLIQAPALWDLGILGQGVVVANMDTGVDINHPELGGRWRGGSNSWYDPYGQHPATPVDLLGHGTWTMGVMVGGGAGGTSIGVAPQAQWIAVKIFNDQGGSTATAIHRGFQWLLDPDSNPATNDAPQVVNNSWAYGAPGCYLEFQPDLQALRAAGILPVFAAGNYGPNPSTSVSPSNNPEAFAVGAINNASQIYTSSSRGPTTCGGSSTVYPELTAPGVRIKTTDLFGLYRTTSGTSLSAPHVAGGLALLLSAFPSLTVSQQENALLSSAVDLGSVGPDNTYGYGRLDLWGAYQWVLNQGSAPTPTPTFTATAVQSYTPTFTASPTPSATPTLTASPTPTFTASPTPTATSPASPTPTATDTPTPTATSATGDTLFGDGFESGDLSAWSSASTNGGLLGASPQAALAGAYGLQAAINSSTAMYAQDDTPAAEMSYHARFYFSPNGVTIPAGTGLNLFTGRAASGAEVFQLQLLYASGTYKIRALIMNNSGKATATSLYPLGGGAHALEIAWQAATTPDGSDGAITLWLDGALLGQRAGIPNGAHRLEDVRLGPQAIGAGISGTVYFDSFLSTRTTTIGP